MDPVTYLIHSLGIARLKIFNPGQISIFAFLASKYWFFFFKIKNQKSIANIGFQNLEGEQNIDIWEPEKHQIFDHKSQIFDYTIKYLIIYNDHYV